MVTALTVTPDERTIIAGLSNGGRLACYAVDLSRDEGQSGAVVTPPSPRR